MSDTDCDELHRAAAHLHAEAEREMREVSEARGDQVSFVARVGDVARREAEARAMEKRIEEDC